MAVVRHFEFLKFKIRGFGFFRNHSNFCENRKICRRFVAKTMFSNTAPACHFEFESFEFWAKDVRHCPKLLKISPNSHGI